MRLFVAAALPESWKDALDRAARALADQGAPGEVFGRRTLDHVFGLTSHRLTVEGEQPACSAML